MENNNSPEFSKEIHYEAEIILKFDKLGKHIDKKFSNKYYNEISLGIDFTARDLQAIDIQFGRGKNFERTKNYS